jgi:bifunctional DNA-binding transcriptional regulator/antitoxin component of YhaV-PrlF toxin-antitoxin module
MSISTLTDKGQTTVPQEVRDALKVKPRQQLQWTVKKDGTAIVRPQPSALDLFGSLPTGKRFRSREAERQGTVQVIAEQAAKEGSK